MSFLVPKAVKDYVFVPSGEAIRGFEITVLWAVVNSIKTEDLSNLGEWRTWATGVGLAALVAGLAYIKGKLPTSG